MKKDTQQSFTKVGGRSRGIVGVAVMVLFVVSSLAMNKTVQALNRAAGNYGYYYGSYGYQASLATSDALPAAPSITCTSVSSTSVSCSWTAVTTTASTAVDNLANYRVFYSTASGTANSSSGTLAATFTPASNSGTITRLITGLTSGTQYFFAVYAKDNNQNTSAISNVANATPASGGAIPAGTNGVISLVDAGVATVTSGTTTAAVSVTVSVETPVTVSGTNIKVTLPANTIITSADGSFNSTALALTNAAASVSNELGAISFGITGESLTFSSAVTFQIDTGANTGSAQVDYSTDGGTTWTKETTCTIASSVCSFSATHATIFAAFATATSATTGGGGGGGGYAVTSGGGVGAETSTSPVYTTPPVTTVPVAAGITLGRATPSVVGMAAVELRAGTFAYGAARVGSLKTEQTVAKSLADYLHEVIGKAKFNKLFWKNADPSKGNRWWYTYVNAYVYGGYPIEAIKQGVRFGGKTVHPTRPWSDWKTSADYKAYINRK